MSRHFYLLKETDDRWLGDYDVYCGLIICAENEAQARQIAKERVNSSYENQYGDDHWTCEVIDPDTCEIGIVLEDYKAG